MRIIAGARKGARLAAPRGEDVRPTTDVVREALFDLLGDVEDSEVLDLFAGSGAVGLEALSRGAARVVLVERDRTALAVVERNVAKLGLPGAEVVRADALARVRADARRAAQYDLIFVDPPYRMAPRLLPALAPFLSALVRPGGCVALETEAALEPQLGLPLRTTRRYGTTRLSLFGAPA